MCPATLGGQRTCVKIGMGGHGQDTQAYIRMPGNLSSMHAISTLGLVHSKKIIIERSWKNDTHLSDPWRTRRSENAQKKSYGARFIVTWAVFPRYVRNCTVTHD